MIKPQRILSVRNKKETDMRQEDKLKEKYGTDPGFRVPDGYFEELNVRIMSNLPSYPEAPRSENLTAWQRVKPYVYLAAMFAGIWLMMNMFHHMSMSSSSLNLENPPEALVQLAESAGYDMSPVFSMESDYDLEHEVSGNYDSIDDFETDFGYELSPQYSSIEVGRLHVKEGNPV